MHVPLVQSGGARHGVPAAPVAQDPNGAATWSQLPLQQSKSRNVTQPASAGKQSGSALHRPRRHLPVPLQAVSLGRFFLHWSWWRRLQGGQRVPAVTSSPEVVPSTRPSAAPRAAITARRREPATVSL